MTMDEKHIKHFIFDMDGTLTESRSTAPEEIYIALSKLMEWKYDIVIISGAEMKQIYKQLPVLSSDPYESLYFLAQSGNHAVRGIVQLWENKLSKEQENRISAHIELCLRHLGVKDRADLIEYRGGQVSFSLVGHNADLAKKKAFDPYGAKRKELLTKFPFEDEELIVRIGGTTCLDYTKRDWGKAGNLKRLIATNNWKIEDCQYFGDQLYEGGNDEDVMDVMDCCQVANPKETYEIIEDILKGYGKEKESSDSFGRV